MSDTPATVDTAQTSAVVDTAAQEIRLPVSAASAVAFWPDGGPDYLVMAPGKVLHFSWNGSTMVENTVVGVTLEPGVNPIAVAAPSPYPDVIVAAPDAIRHYSFNGAGMDRNPALEAAGLTGVAAVGTRGSGDLATLAGGVVKHYSSTGSGMTENPWLEPNPAVLNNPVSIALRPDNLDLAVADTDPATGQGRVRFFGFTGAGMSELPALAITGLADAKAVAYGQNGDVAVVSGTQVRQYSFDGAAMSYNAALSVTAGLAGPTALAIRPGSFDRIIVDGDNVRYFTWNGSALVEDPSRSATVAGLSALGRFQASAGATSLAFDPGVNSDRVRVRAAHSLDANTQVVWSATANGTTWTKRWRARADAAGVTTCEVTPDNGVTWQAVGWLAQCGPGADLPDLWVQVSGGRLVRWKAELLTGDGSKTPRVKAGAPGAAAVVLEADARPAVGMLPGPAGCYNTTRPTFSWTFSDPDAGDSQSAFQVEVRRKSDGAMVYDSGKALGGVQSYTLPTSSDPAVAGPLWSAGTYRFTWRVRAWDSLGQESDWSAPQDFCVVALERLRVVEIVSPPAGQTAPDPNNPATHILVWPGQTENTLPKAKAGARVRMRVDGVGPVQSFTAAFRYQDGNGTTKTATIGPGTPTWLNPTGAETNRWDIDVWTEAPLDVVPTGTVLKAELTGNAGGAGTARWVTTAPNESGVYVTQGSIYEDWVVVLQGSQ